MWRYVSERVNDAYRRDLSVLDACNEWYSGAYLMETIPSVLYILMRHGDDLEEALVRAVNDTVAAIVGAAVGALHGAAAIPLSWRTALLGRLGPDDDGHLFTLLDRIRRQWLS